MEQRDYSALLPNQPPKDFTNWLNSQGELEEQLLIYKSVWWENPKTGKKQRKIELKCSVCGEYSYADSAESGGCMNVKGFEHPKTHDFVSSTYNRSCHCPHCGHPVQAKHAKEIRGVYSFKACHAMTVHKIESFLALCGWCVMKHFDVNGDSYTTIHPYEAYVVEKRKIVRLNAWQSNCGGHKRLTNTWVQRQRYQDTWGLTSLIYPWDPELLVGTTMENSKLNLYLDQIEGEHGIYPVRYLKLYQKHPNIENLLVQGAENLVVEMIDKNAVGSCYTSSDTFPDINWKEKRPAQMLGLEKDQFKRLVSEQWNVENLRVFLFLQRNQYPTDPDTYKKCAVLGHWRCREIEQNHPGDLIKIANYIAKQKKKNYRNDYNILSDYWRMATTVGYDLENPDIRFPSRLFSAHDRVTVELKDETVRINEEKMAQRFADLSQFAWSSGGILIRPAKSVADLKEEGEKLHHCVGTYANQMAEGKTAIFFIRREKSPDQPWYTLELGEKNLKIKQNRGNHNKVPPEEVLEFQALWLEHIQTMTRANKNKKNKKRRNAA